MTRLVEISAEAVGGVRADVADVRGAVDARWDGLRARAWRLGVPTSGFDEVLDQSDIADQGFSTVWGVADEYLFTEALHRLDRSTASGQPVFMGMLTVSNHRPYTFPPGAVQPDPAVGAKENVAHYAAWAFSDFIERARSRPWFKDTVFVFVGDHGPRVAGAAQVPVERFRVPLQF